MKSATIYREVCHHGNQLLRNLAAGKAGLAAFFYCAGRFDSYVKD